MRQAERPDKVVGLIDEFSYGPTDPDDIKGRETFIGDVLGYDWEDHDTRKMRKAFWRNSLDTRRRRVVWLSRWSATEYSNFLAWLERNGDAPFDLVDLTDTVLPGRRDPSVLEPVAYTAVVGAAQFVEHQLWDRAEPFTEQQRGDAMRLWGRLRREDAPLRAITPEGLVSAPLTYFDEDLMRHISADWIEAGLVVGKTLSALMSESFRPARICQCGDLVLFSRVRALVKDNVLQKKGRLHSGTFKARRRHTG